MANEKEKSPVAIEDHSPVTNETDDLVQQNQPVPDTVNNLSPHDSPFPSSVDSPSFGDAPTDSLSLSTLVDTAIGEAAEAEAAARQEVASLIACFFQSVESQAPIEVTQTVAELVDGVTGTMGVTPRWQPIRKECWEEVVEATQQCEAIVQALWRLLVVGMAVP